MTDALIRDAAQALDLAKHNPEALAEWARGYGGALLDHEIAQWAEAGRLRQALTAAADALETAWGVIANAGGGDWTRETEIWQGAAARWRGRYFAWLDTQRLAAGAPEEPQRA